MEDKIFENSKKEPKITKEGLKNYSFISKEIIQLQEEMEMIKRDILENSDENLIDDIRLEKLIVIYEKIRTKRELLLNLLCRIEDSIDELEPLERVLMREHYINGSKWEKVADKIGYSWAQTHRHHRKALEKLMV